jgi:threonine synthase
MQAHVFMPSDVSPLSLAECQILGADVTFVDGLITDCGRAAARGVRSIGRFDLSTLKEPYRLEGEKTMGYELAEQLGWTLPDVISYPPGGGTGLIGMWKALDEMEQLGWIGEERPRMVAVQSDGCAPMVRAFQRGSRFAEVREEAATIADGLRVPAAVGDSLILKTLRDSGGTAVAVPDQQMLEAASLIGRTQGIFLPRGGSDPPCLSTAAEQGVDRPRRVGCALLHGQWSQVRAPMDLSVVP